MFLISNAKFKIGKHKGYFICVERNLKILLVLQDPIEKLANKVEELSEARKEKLNRVRLVELEKQRLEQPMKEAVEIVNVTNMLTHLRSTLLQKYQ